RPDADDRAVEAAPPPRVTTTPQTAGPQPARDAAPDPLPLLGLPLDLRALRRDADELLDRLRDLPGLAEALWPPSGPPAVAPLPPAAVALEVARRLRRPPPAPPGEVLDDAVAALPENQ